MSLFFNRSELERAPREPDMLYPDWGGGLDEVQTPQEAQTRFDPQGEKRYYSINQRMRPERK